MQGLKKDTQTQKITFLQGVAGACSRVLTNNTRHLTSEYRMSWADIHLVKFLSTCEALKHWLNMPDCLLISRRLPLQLSGLVSDLPHQVQSQCHELGRRLVTGHSRRLALVHGTNCHHRFVAFLLLLLLNVNSRLFFYSITLLSNIVRRPCCV